MIIRKVYVRFFRSFNYDHLRKALPDAHERGPWELLADGLWYPFVEVGLQDDITTVVGANEAGKSQLLSAVKFALTGEGIDEQDFCRYSRFFSVESEMRHPDFGLHLVRLTDAERSAVGAACGTSELPSDEFRLFRINDAPPVVYLDDGAGGYVEHVVEDQELLAGVLPEIFEIDSKVPLPDKVPVSFLVDGEVPHRVSHAALRLLEERGPEWFESTATATAALPELLEALVQRDVEDDGKRRDEYALARDLLVTVAGVDESAFALLRDALTSGAEGQVNGIVSQINQQLAKRLNFPKYWSQDSDFALLVTTRGLDLAFTIRDRTGTDYSFGERSGGLRYFLSYFVQALAHRPARSTGGEVLLMDEPDAFLSSSGQQDLMRIFADYALPDDEGRKSQVLYVTHSPFLIDKNHGERIRVLDKGQGDEGTRVVANSASNHYEPLRSAFGSFVGETTFIGNCNLMLEGITDQIILAGVSTLLQRAATPTTQYLDLNKITLVPAGGAPHVPYMAYLALGRDADSPAVIVLLDSDQAGDDARRALKKARNGRPVLGDDLVLQIGELSDEVTSDRVGGPREIEDLLPAGLMVRAAQRYVRDLLGQQEHARVSGLTPAGLDLGAGAGLHEATEAMFKDVLGEDFELGKLGLSRSVVDLLGSESVDDDRAVLERNFRALFTRLNRLQRDADVNVMRQRVGKTLKRTRKAFFMDHPEGATREHGGLLMEDLDRQLSDSPKAEEWRLELLRVRRSFSLDHDLVEPIRDFESFRTAVDGLVTFQERQTMPESVAADGQGQPAEPAEVVDGQVPAPAPVQRSRRTQRTAAAGAGSED